MTPLSSLVEHAGFATRTLHAGHSFSANPLGSTRIPRRACGASDDPDATHVANGNDLRQGCVSVLRLRANPDGYSDSRLARLSHRAPFAAAVRLRDDHAGTRGDPAQRSWSVRSPPSFLISITRLPAGDEVLHALRAHRGLSHSLIAVPVVALAAALLTKLLFRRARLGALFTRGPSSRYRSRTSCPICGRGWGTRLLYRSPSAASRSIGRWSVDPFFTLPVLAAAIWAAFRRGTFRRAFGWGVLVSATLPRRPRRPRSGPDCRGSARLSGGGRGERLSVTVRTTSFRYVATVDGEYRAGSVALGSAPDEQGRSKPFPTGPLSERLKSIPTLREALVWARFPVVRAEAEGGSGYRVEVADLRYHLRGQPTLAFVMSVQDDRVTEAPSRARWERSRALRPVPAKVARALFDVSRPFPVVGSNRLRPCWRVAALRAGSASRGYLARARGPRRHHPPSLARSALRPGAAPRR